ncbi:MAG: hypothetical protein ABEL76_08325 [Bradymonadaceae bacterium]
MRKCAILLGLILAIWGTACASDKSKEKKSSSSGGHAVKATPKWARQPPKGCAAGIVKYRGNTGMARNASIGRARDEFARKLETTVQGMLKDYTKQGTADGESFTEAQIEQTSRQIVDQKLVGTRVVKSVLWKTPEGKKNHVSLVCLEPGTLSKAFKQMENLSDAQRKALEKRAEKAFDDLDKQLKKLDE